MKSKSGRNWKAFKLLIQEDAFVGISILMSFPGKGTFLFSLQMTIRIRTEGQNLIGLCFNTMEFELEMQPETEA